MDERVAEQVDDRVAERVDELAYERVDDWTSKLDEQIGRANGAFTRPSLTVFYLRWTFRTVG